MEEEGRRSPKLGTWVRRDTRHFSHQCYAVMPAPTVGALDTTRANTYHPAAASRKSNVCQPSLARVIVLPSLSSQITPHETLLATGVVAWSTRSRARLGWLPAGFGPLACRPVSCHVSLRNGGRWLVFAVTGNVNVSVSGV